MKRFGILVGLVVLLPATAMAQGFGRGDPAARWDHLQKQHDKDGDGKITAAEYDRGEQKFARFDRDGDGVLTAADFERGGGRGNRGGGRREGGQRRGGGRRGSRFGNMAGLEIAKHADADRSGSIPAAEWKAFMASLAGDDGVVDMAKLGMSSSMGGMMGRMVSGMLDADGDGEITTDDLAPMFEQLDKNEDSTLQRDELGKLPWPGEVAPDFELPFAGDNSKTVKLSSFKDDRPVALIFGSYT